MPVTTAGDFGHLIGARMRAEHQSLAARWLDRLNELLPVSTDEVFPTQSLLDHIPALILEIATCVADADTDEFVANTFVLDKARELGELRYDQRASVHQLLREYRVLSAILVTFVEQETRGLDLVAPSDVIAVLSRVTQAVGVLQQTTVETFIGRYTARIDEQTRRLENFNRMVSHELRQPIGALQFAFRLADSSDEPSARAGYHEVIDRNLTRLVRLTDQLAMMSRLKPATDTAQTQQGQRDGDCSRAPAARLRACVPRARQSGPRARHRRVRPRARDRPRLREGPGGPRQRGVAPGRRRSVQRHAAAVRHTVRWGSCEPTLRHVGSGRYNPLFAAQPRWRWCGALLDVGR
jgi:signal transduction histidine kinase